MVGTMAAASAAMTETTLWQLIAAVFAFAWACSALAAWHFRRALRPWKPRDWTVEPEPCLGAGCSPQTPRCFACRSAIALMGVQGMDPATWPELSEFARESWRIEARDEMTTKRNT